MQCVIDYSMNYMFCSLPSDRQTVKGRKVLYGFGLRKSRA